jgi:hypothetical protein|tara:strand:- start:1552 stop:1824 length:273 start_codon:yes stop_codon:yes gene_type:complete
MGRPSKYTQKTVDAVHQMEEEGKTIKQTAKKMKLKVEQIKYLLYKRKPSESASLPYGYGNKFKKEPVEKVTKKNPSSLESFLKKLTSWLS